MGLFIIYYLFIYLTGANKTEHFLTDGEEQHKSNLCENHSFTFFMTSTSKKLINLLFLNVVSFPFVLGYLLVEGFSLTQFSIGGPEDDGCSLVTYLGL